MIHAAEIVTRLMDPMPVESFFSVYYGKMPYASAGGAAHFSDFLSWEVVDEIMATGHEEIWIAKSGVLVPHQNNTPPSREAARESFYKKGCSVLVRHAEQHDAVISEIAQDFESVFEKPADVHIYATPANHEGFGWHYDIEDVFAIQCSGQKEFVLRANTVNPHPSLDPLPRDLHFEREHSKLQFKCLLVAGDWLYIPPGWWHKARALEHSFHLSIGIMSGPDDPKKNFL